MAKKDKLIKNKSIYTIKKKHASLTDSIIYENDYITIIPNDGIYDDEMALFSESNFKYLIETQGSEKKRHVRGDYVKSNNNNEFWTLNDVGKNNESAESKIISKPNYSSLKDFAYYGSAVELVKATVNDIILRFPGGLSYYNEDYLAPQIVVKNGSESVTYTLISNEFEIDCWTNIDEGVFSGIVKNPMRILSLSYANYTTANFDADEETEESNVINKPEINITGYCPNTIIGQVVISNANSREHTLDIYMDGEHKKYLVTSGSGKGLIIRPKTKNIKEFWENIDDFERVLLNRDSTPIYKAIFETPYSNDTGYYYQNKAYIWPTVNNDGFTPDITTGAFQGYLESLIELATFHDKYDSDNIWRMMTHESIKNLDWTFISENDGEEKDRSDFETKGMGAMIRIYGRQFDDIKRYADNIKSTNSISYDEKNNVPDYFLSDAIENEGWEAQHVAPFEESKSADVNISFQRRLALSSNYIQSLKGTRRGIEAVLGLFGYKNTENNYSGKGTYTILEKVAVTTSGLSYEEASQIRVMGGEYLNDDENINFMNGYPVAVVDVNGNGNTNDFYLIPWFDKKQKYDHPFYFQGKGGWGKMSSKNINLSNDITTATTISGGYIYRETLPYMRFANTIDEMLSIDYSTLFDGMICYVTDISTIDKRYTPKTDEWKSSNASHYFILKNKTLSSYCGYVGNVYQCYGWKNVTKGEISDASTDDGVKIIYMESLNAEYKGNNPHAGLGQYDDGNTYLDKFKILFEENFKNGKYEHLKDEDVELYCKASEFGFNDIEIVEDNKKCAYYHDYTEGGVWLGEEENGGDKGWNSIVAKDVLFVDTPSLEDIPSLEDGPCDESQANGIINIKNMEIIFHVGGDEEMIKYIQNVVLTYLEPMIPSTTIVEYRFSEGLKTAMIGDTITINNSKTIEIPGVAHVLYKE